MATSTGSQTSIPTAASSPSRQRPYPLAGDLIVDGVAASSQPDALRCVSQRLDFATGELSTRFTVDVNDTSLAVDIVTFCCRRHPAPVLQQLTVRSDRACDVEIVAAIEPAGIPGTVAAVGEIPAGKPCTPDGFLLSKARAGGARCGFAIATAAEPEIQARPPRVRRGANGRLEVGRPLHLASGHTASLRTIVGIVPDLAHAPPERAGRSARRSRDVSWLGCAQQALAIRRPPPVAVTGRDESARPHTLPTDERTTTSGPWATNTKY